MKLEIDIAEKDYRKIEHVRFLLGGKEDRDLQSNIINAIKNGKIISKDKRTNADYIRSLPTEELAAFISPFFRETCDCTRYCKDFRFGCAYSCNHDKIKEFVVAWLEDICDKD